MNHPDRELSRRLHAVLAEASAVVPPVPSGLLAQTRHRFIRQRTRRTRMTAAACAATVLAIITLTGVGAGPFRGWWAGLGRDSAAEAADGDQITVWTLRSDTRVRATQQCASTYTEATGIKVRQRVFGSSLYRERLLGAMGTDAAPDIFLNWGGADLRDLARGKQLVDLTDALRAAPRTAAAFRPAILAQGRVDGRQYALPMSGTQPVVLFYNQTVFADAGLRPPRTYADLLALIDAFQGRGITPMALSGTENWTALLYLMYLVDRLGGAQVAADIAAGSPGAWKNPALVSAARMLQDLSERGAFGNDQEWLAYSPDDASRLLTSGRAAMLLMGTWEYTTQLAANPVFARSGELGWTTFPTVPGGSGDPASLVGVPANFYSVSANSPHAAQAVDFLLRTLTSRRYLQGLLDGAETPATTTLGPARPDPRDAEFIAYTDRLVSSAPSFTLPLDQLLGLGTATELDGALRRLLMSDLTAEQFAVEMQKPG